MSKSTGWSVLHVINGLTRGGASRTLAALANEQVRSGDDTIAIVSLTPAQAGSEDMLRGVKLLDGLRRKQVLEHMANSHIVHAHLWNSPEILELLSYSLPPLRLVMWFHVASRAPPQRIPGAILPLADALVLTSSATLQHKPFAGLQPEPEVIVPVRDLTAFFNVKRSSSPGIVCGHVGSLDPLRLPDDLLPAYAKITDINVRFEFVGGGPKLASLRDQAAQFGLSERISFHGMVTDVAAALGGFDIFCSVQSARSYATSDMSIEEAMAAGLPCVLLSPEGSSDLVEHGVTGFVTGSSDDYVAALRTLARDADLRHRLGRQARERAWSRLKPETMSDGFRDLYEQLLSSPKSEKAPLKRRDPQSTTVGAEAFLFVVDDDVPEFGKSLRASPAMARAADDRITLLDGAIWSEGLGGVRHYAQRHPRDRWLAFWSGLGYLAQNAPVRALLEFRKAVDNGMAAERVAPFERQARQRVAVPAEGRVG